MFDLKNEPFTQIKNAAAEKTEQETLHMSS